MIDADHVAERVLDLVGGRAEAEVTAAIGRSALTRFANSVIHQNVADDYVSVSLKVAVDGRIAGSTTNVVDGDGLNRLVESTIDAARLRPVDPEWPGLTAPRETSLVEHYDAETHFASPDMRAQQVRAFAGAGADAAGAAVSSARGASLAAGFCSTNGYAVVFANSAGHRLSGRATDSAVEGIHRLGTSDGSGWQTSFRAAGLNGEHAGRTAVEKARAGVDAVDIEPGRYEVVLEPACVADILFFLGWYGFNGKAHADGRSFVELGTLQFDPSIDVWDDATDERTTGLGFDAEGTPRRRLDLVRGGVSAGLTHDRRTAARAGGGAESTGHAVPGGETAGAMASNLFLGGGSLSPAELIGSVNRGLLVTEFWYTRILDPKTQVVTGLTRNGTFLVEKGRVTTAVRNLRFTQGYVDALGPGNVLGIGNDARLFGGSAFVPSLRLAGWNFTGGTRG